ncbi:MAG: RnfABCDGE type electron transport complex subunit D [Clostridia bacterium]|nr:RnfABCDGE type electron transport complex subunit D [Clostridia bacterium]
MTPAIHISVSPHDRASETTAAIMRDVVIALVPPLGMGVYAFGFRALLVIAVCVTSCILTEYFYQKLMKQPVTVSDLSAVVTGMILAVNMPAGIPLWMPLLGGVFAILVVKQLFGGLGQNIMNPALAARCFLLISFASAMTTFPDTVRTLFEAGAQSGATPLALVKAGESPDWTQMLLNTHNGCIGEASTIAVLIGAAYLLARRVITVHIPALYILSTVGFVCLINVIAGSADVITVNYLIAQICGGGLLIGAFFMANDYVTCPVTPWGQVIYACLLGLLTALFRVVGSSAEGVSFAIILGNLFVPLIERVTVPRPYGVSRKKGGRA